MYDFLDLIFQTFWTFLGFAILLSIMVIFIYNLIFNTIQRFLRHRVMMKYGYIEGCDADGEFPKSEEEETTTEEYFPEQGG